MTYAEFVIRPIYIRGIFHWIHEKNFRVRTNAMHALNFRYRRRIESTDPLLKQKLENQRLIIGLDRIQDLAGKIIGKSLASGRDCMWA